MDLDALSGVVAYKHTGDGVTTVTAACDRITIQHPLTEICDLELSGRVTYATGRSSMEITLQVAKALPPIKVETEEEQRIYNEGEQNSKHRKDLSKRSLLKQTPNDEESDLIHALWQRQLQYHDPNDPLRKPENVQFMDKTQVSTASIMQPQYRNRYVCSGALILLTITYIHDLGTTS